MTTQKKEEFVMYLRNTILGKINKIHNSRITNIKFETFLYLHRILKNNIILKI